VTATVLFLRDIGSGGPEASQLDIGCIKLTAYRLPDGANVISAQPIIPIPETEAYQVRKRRRQADEESSRQERTRVRNAVPVLQQAGAIAPGTELHVNLAWFSDKDRVAIQGLLDREPVRSTLVWTGELNARRAVRKAAGEEPISLGAAYEDLRLEAALNSAPDATSAWLVGTTGKNIRELADEVLAGTGSTAAGVIAPSL